MLDILRERRTHKVIGDTDAPTVDSGVSADRVDELVASAGNAPVHYACDRIHLAHLSSPVPWRCYKLDGKSCTQLMEELLANGDSTKVPNMLAAADYLLQVTWLPDDKTIIDRIPEKDKPAFVGTLRNMEHIAAASAFIQSLLLAAQNDGFRTYWSSGGPLRTSAIFERLGIPDTELLIGSVFLFPPNPENAEIKSGNMADKRGDPSQWSKWTKLS